MEQEIKERCARLTVSPGEAPFVKAEVLKRQDDLALEAVEHILVLESLEVRECQAAAAEDAITAREAQV